MTFTRRCANPQQQSLTWFEPKEKQRTHLIQKSGQRALCLRFNGGGDAVDFSLLPAWPGARRYLMSDTSHESSDGLFAAGAEPLCETHEPTI